MSCKRCKHSFEPGDSTYTINFIKGLEGQYCAGCARIMGLKRGIMDQEEEDFRHSINLHNVLGPKKRKAKTPSYARNVLDHLYSFGEE